MYVNMSTIEFVSVVLLAASSCYLVVRLVSAFIGGR